MKRLFASLAIPIVLAATLTKPAPAAVASGVPWTAQEILRLEGSLRRLLAAPELQGAQVGLLAVDTVRGTVVFSQNADQEFIPASNFKLLTGSAATASLGNDFTFTTQLFSDAPAANGVVNGNLYLRGGGDALLRAADLRDAAAALFGAGIRRVSGSLVYDVFHYDDQRYGQGLLWDDLPYEYAPAVSALELEDGIAHVFLSPGSTTGSPAIVRIDPQSNAFDIINEVVTGAAGSRDTTDIMRPWDKPRTIVLTGTYPLGGGESSDLQPSVPDPPEYAADVLRQSFAAAGIQVIGATSNGRAPSGASLLWEHHSHPLTQVLADFWLPSDNLIGEELLKELGVVYGGEPGTYANGELLEARYLTSIGIDPATVTIADGSGYSTYDRITPRDLFLILQSDWNAPYRDTILSALPLAGVRGTLADSFTGTPAEGKVFAKTGSMNHVRTLSGFITTRTHGPLTFSFLINGWMGADRKDGAAMLDRVRGAILSELAVQ